VKKNRGEKEGTKMGGPKKYLALNGKGRKGKGGL